MTAPGPGQPGPGQLLFGFVRHWSRRSTIRNANVADQGRLILATEAVGALAGRQEPATVNAVAEEIGIDQSGASRVISDAVDAGYLTLVTAQFDGRKRQASVTRQGHAVLRYAHEWQEQVFEELTEGWSQRRREEFAHAMADLVTRSYALGHGTPPTSTSR